MTPRSRTTWTVLRYNYPDHPLDPQEMWRPFGLPDDIHMIWSEDLMVMEIWYGGQRHRAHSLEQLLDRLNVSHHSS